MKPIYLLLVLLMASCVSTKRVTLNDEKVKIIHKSLKKFNNDTIQYALFNYIDHKDQFIGKPASLIFNSLEYEIVSFLPGSDLFYRIDAIDLSPFYSGKPLDNIKTIELIVEFANPIPEDSISKLFPVHGTYGNWTPEVREVFGKLIVKDIVYLKYPRKNPRDPN